MNNQSAELQQRINELSDFLLVEHMDPVVMTLKEEAAGDPLLLDLLDKLKLLAPINLGSGYQPNAWATGDPASPFVGIDIIFFLYIIDLSKLIALSAGLVNREDGSQIVRRASYNHGLKLRQTVERNERTPPIFEFRIEEYSANPLVYLAVDRFWPYVLSQIIAWVTLHEIAHHYLGHLRPEQIAKASQLDRLEQLNLSRQQEADADEWAYSKMAEFAFPMEMLETFFGFEANFEELLRKLGRNPQGTHPTWAARRNAVQKYAYTRQAPSGKARRFVTILEIPDLETGEYSPAIAEMLVPNEQLLRNSIPLTHLFQGDEESFVYTEYQGNSIHLYGRAPGVRFVFEIEDKISYQSRLIMRTIDETTAQESVSETVTVQLPLTLYDMSIQLGPGSLKELLNKDALTELRRLSRRVIRDESVQQRFEAVALQHNRNLGDLFRRFAQGEVSLQATEQNITQLETAYAERLDSVIGRSAREIMENLVQSDPFITWGMDQVTQVAANRTQTGIEPVTMETPLGTMLVSNRPAAQPIASISGAAETYTDPNFGFRIAWPGGGRWIRGQATGLPEDPVVELYFTQASGNFAPNINLLVDPSGFIPIRYLMYQSDEVLREEGYNVVDRKLDEATQSGVRIMRPQQAVGPLLQLQRVIIGRRFVYTATASVLESAHRDTPMLDEEICQIMNSLFVTD